MCDVQKKFWESARLQKEKADSRPAFSLGG